jgi:hypothetical protein
MILHAILRGANFRRTNPLSVATSEFAGTSTVDGMRIMQFPAFTTSGFYVEGLFSGSLTTRVGLEAYIKTYGTTSACLQFNWFANVKVAAMAYAGYRGYPTTVQVYGSNDFEFNTQTLLLDQTMPSAETCVDDTFLDWFNFTSIQSFKFIRVYFIGPFVYRTGESSSGNISEIKFKVTDDTINNPVFLTYHGYTDHLNFTETAQTGSTPQYAFAYGFNNAWRVSWDAFNAPGGCWLQIDSGAAKHMNLYGFAIQQGQGSQYQGQGAPLYYSLKCSTTGAFAGEETTIIDNQLFDVGAMSKDNQIVSPWVEFTGPGKHRYYRWYFFGWNELDHESTITPGIGKFYLKYHQDVSV